MSEQDKDQSVLTTSDQVKEVPKLTKEFNLALLNTTIYKPVLEQWNPNDQISLVGEPGEVREVSIDAEGWKKHDLIVFLIDKWVTVDVAIRHKANFEKYLIESHTYGSVDEIIYNLDGSYGYSPINNVFEIWMAGVNSTISG
jgi:hypothetical protein